ncbi:MAG: MAPEG family protein [Rhodobacteraceae bacterium]|nr:MAPEG family protein [Paracoccaceae bacterium]
MLDFQFPVSMTFIAICAALMTLMVAYVGLYRGKVKVLRGDGGNAILFKRIRIHGNFMETAPLTALVMMAAEVAGLGATWLWLAFGSFFLGRVLHFVLFDSTKRGIAMSLTVFPGFLMGVWILSRIWGM